VKGYTPLHLAADRGHLEIVKLLLGKGVDKSIKVRAFGSIDMIKSIIAGQDPDDMTALELAQIVGHSGIVSALSG
jgi:ankyrin repeat protein